MNFNSYNPYSKVHGADMGPTWALLAPDGSHDGPMNLAIKEWLIKIDGIHILTGYTADMRSWVNGINNG